MRQTGDVYDIVGTKNLRGCRRLDKYMNKSQSSGKVLVTENVPVLWATGDWESLFFSF